MLISADLCPADEYVQRALRSKCAYSDFVSNTAIGALIGSCLIIFAGLHWRYSLWWMMSNRYGTGKTTGKPVLPWMRFQRVVGTVSSAAFGMLFIWSAVHG